jgi:hypothetical protein
VNQVQSWLGLDHHAHHRIKRSICKENQLKYIILGILNLGILLDHLKKSIQEVLAMGSAAAAVLSTVRFIMRLGSTISGKSKNAMGLNQPNKQSAFVDKAYIHWENFHRGPY